MKRTPHRNPVAGLFVLLFCLVSMQYVSGCPGRAGTKTSDPPGPFDARFQGEIIYVSVSGDVSLPGVHAFQAPPSCVEVLERVWMGKGHEEGAGCEEGPYPSGAWLHVRVSNGNILVTRREMGAFHKITLGIPLSLNEETEEGLTAIPGIGPKTAAAIVHQRTVMGGYEDMRDLLSVSGLGPVLYARITPFLKL